MLERCRRRRSPVILREETSDQRVPLCFSTLHLLHGFSLRLDGYLQGNVFHLQLATSTATGLLQFDLGLRSSAQVSDSGGPDASDHSEGDTRRDARPSCHSSMVPCDP